MEIVKENPRKYNAVQFDQELVNKYGLIKYPMVHEAIRPVQTFSEANKAVRKGIFGRRRKIMQDVPVYKITKSYYIDNVFKRNPVSGRTEVTSGDWIQARFHIKLQITRILFNCKNRLIHCKR